MRRVSLNRHPRGWRSATVLVAVLLVAACDSGPAPSGTSTTPATATAGPTATPAGTGPVASGVPSPTVTAAPPTLTGLAPGSLAVTVTDGLRVRSEPRVAADSIKYEPLLPLGTQVVVIGGPVTASLYTWYQVAPLGVKLGGGMDQGWVAVADHDGTPWVALAADPTPGYELAAATVGRAPANLADAKVVSKAINAFGLDLYRRMTSDPTLAKSGLVVSPASIVFALAMARAGANGPTGTEMDRLLRVTGWNQLGTGVSSLDQLLTTRNASWQDDAGVLHTLSLRVANTAFAQRGFGIAPTYIDRIGRSLGAGLGLVDYASDPKGALDAINGWVARQTLGRIPALLTPLDVTDATRLVLVNAIYLKANWAREFDPSGTVARAFTRLDGTKVMTPTMTLLGEQDVVLAKGAGWKATELRYLGADGQTPLAMTLILPDDLAAYEAALTPARLGAVQAAIAAEQKRLETVTYTNHGGMSCGGYPYNVRLYLPRFGVETRASLGKVLRAMGLRLATDPAGADFSGITTPSQLSIASVIHQANIDVDETGTVAAAATAIGFNTTGGCGPLSPARTLTLRFDRPFLFLIRDLQTGGILFMGRVVDPTKR